MKPSGTYTELHVKGMEGRELRQVSRSKPVTEAI
jgi:hypothetical protein